MIVNDEGVNEFAADATVYRVAKTREDFVMEADETQELLDCALKDDTEDKCRVFRLFFSRIIIRNSTPVDT